jgi:SAM-dependent methyltransferase
MAVLAARTLLPDSRREFALGVGAGTKATSFYLTNLFRWVLATDPHASDDRAQDSPPAMLSSPERFAGDTPFRKRHLVVQNMDACNVEHEDATFALIYSCSSIEHFGTREQIKQASAEMGRVLKPGGILAISTEYCVRGTPGYLVHDTPLLGPDDICELIVAPSGCDPVDDLRFQVSEATLRNPLRQRDALRDRIRMQSDPGIPWSQYPHLLLVEDERVWTSYQLTLRQPG